MHPILFHFGPIAIYSYGVMLMIGFIAAVLWTRREASRRGVDPGKIVDLSIWLLVSGIVGARLGFVLLNLHYYLGQTPAALLFSDGKIAIQGLSFHGALVGAVSALLIYAWRTKTSWLLLADIFAPALAIGYGFGRIGCFLNGCCYGAPTHLPWGTQFLIDPATHTWTPECHPTQLYAALGSWLIFGLLLWLRPRLSGQGQLFASYLGLYGVLRFLVEIFRRGYTAQILVGPLTEAQVASIFLLIASVFLLIYLRPREAIAQS